MLLKTLPLRIAILKICTSESCACADTFSRCCFLHTFTTALNNNIPRERFSDSQTKTKEFIRLEPDMATPFPCWVSYVRRWCMPTRKTEKPFELRDSRALCECSGCPAEWALLLSAFQFTALPWQRTAVGCYVSRCRHMSTKFGLYLQFETSVCSGFELFGCRPRELLGAIWDWNAQPQGRVSPQLRRLVSSETWFISLPSPRLTDYVPDVTVGRHLIGFWNWTCMYKVKSTESRNNCIMCIMRIFIVESEVLTAVSMKISVLWDAT
jgi:hypothetical protein